MTRQAAGTPVDQEALFVKQLVDRIESLEKIAHVHPDLAVRLQFPRKDQAATILSGTTSGNDEAILGTVFVPALDIDTFQEARAFWTGAPDSAGAGSRWVFRVRQDNIGGSIRASVIVERPDLTGQANRYPFVVSTSDMILVPAGNSMTYLTTIQRSAGGANAGTIREPAGGGGHMTIESTVSNL